MQDVPLILKSLISDSQRNFYACKGIGKKSHGNKLIFFSLSYSGSAFASTEKYCINQWHLHIELLFRTNFFFFIPEWWWFPFTTIDFICYPLFHTPWYTLLDEWNWMNGKGCIMERIIINKFWVNWILSGGIFGSADFLLELSVVEWSIWKFLSSLKIKLTQNCLNWLKTVRIYSNIVRIDSRLTEFTKNWPK